MTEPQGEGAEAVRHEQRASAQILELERDLERERGKAQQALEALQRRLEETEARAAENVRVTDTRSQEPEPVAERDSSEATGELERRLRAEFERKLAKQIKRIRAEAGVHAREEIEAARQAAEQRFEAEREAREEARRREREAAATAAEAADRGLDELAAQIEAAGRRVDAAVAKLEADTRGRLREETERERAGLEAQVKADAADWIRRQTDNLERRAERAAKSELTKAKRAAERRLAERERELAAELDQAARALRTAENQVREAESRAEAAERRLGETSDEELRRAADRRAARLRAIEDRIGVVVEKAAGAEAHAATADLELPAVKMERETDEQNAVAAGPTSPEVSPGQARLDVNKATFDQLRELGMTVTQATRVIAYRERENGFESPDDLATVPGLSKKFVAGIRGRLTA